MKLPVPFALALQSGFNRLIALDEESKRKLERIQHKLLKIEVTTLGLNIFLLFHSDRVEVLEAFAGEADATIKGPPFSMLALAVGRGDASDSAVEIAGDVETAQQVSRMLQHIDIDWEEHFSKVTGDAVAHQLGNIASGIGRFANRTRDSMQSNTADYLRDETGHLPHDWQLESFTNEVDDLRDRVALLERRISLLRAQNANGQPYE